MQRHILATTLLQAKEIILKYMESSEISRKRIMLLPVFQNVGDRINIEGECPNFVENDDIILACAQTHCPKGEVGL